MKPDLALRDWLAAHAPVLPEFLRDALADERGIQRGKKQVDLQDYADKEAKWAYLYADAMLLERTERPSP